MHKQTRFYQVFIPSVASGIICTLLALLTLMASNYYYSAGKGAIYNFIFGKNSSVELIGQSKSTVGTISDTIFGNHILNKVLYFAFWMMVGLLVYLLLYTLIKGVSSAAEDIEQAAYTNSRLDDLEHTVGVRLAIRTAATILWFSYSLIFVKLLVPFSIVSARSSIRLFPRPIAWLDALIGWLVLSFCLHLHVVFLRLVTLRVRLFGTD